MGFLWGTDCICVLYGSHSWDSKVWLWFLSDSVHWVITLQIADPSSRQRGRPPETRPQTSDSNIPTGSNIWSQVPQGYSIPRHTDWLTVTRKVTSPQQTATVSSNSINRLGSLAETWYDSCEVRTRFVYPISIRWRGGPTETRQQLSDNNLRTESNIWSQVPEWARYLDILTD
jgi:hypothetical protein